MDFQCYQILIVTADGEAIILEEDGIIELVSDFSFADSIDDLFELIKNLFPDLEELSDAQFDFFKRYTYNYIKSVPIGVFLNGTIQFRF